MKKRLLKITQFVATFGLLALVFYQAGLFTEDGRAGFIDTLRNANLNWLIAAVLIGVVVNIVSAFKWYLLIRSQGMMAGYWRVFAYYVIGQFYNMFLPTSVGGDVVRSYELGKYSGRQADALASVFVERYTGVLTLLALAFIAVATQLGRFNVDFVILSLGLFALALLLIGWLVFDHRVYSAIKRRMSRVHPRLEALFAKIDKLLGSVDAYRGHPTAVILAFVNSLAFYFAAVVNVYITSLVFNIDVSFYDMLIATPIIMVIMNLPISFGNIGLMEFAYTNVFLIMGYGPELGLSVAVLMRLKSLFDGAIGGILHPIFVTQKHE